MSARRADAIVPMTPRALLPSNGWAHLRALVRASELYLAMLAALVGTGTGAVVVGMSAVTKLLHLKLFSVPLEDGLSAATTLPRWSLAVPAVGGLVLGLTVTAFARRRKRAIVDPIEANALHGGQMSLSDSVVLAVQTVISNGFGASVGLEAGYTQIGSAFGSRAGRAFRLRRQDMRTLVGCGAAAAISAAFNAPITGAFYAFELIIGSYAIATMAPVMAASIAAVLAATSLGGVSAPLALGPLVAISAGDYPLFMAIGLICGLFGIGIMRAVSLVEAGVARLRVPTPIRPVLGGAVLGGLAMLSPQVLSAGHGALHVELTASTTLTALLTALVLKSLGSIVSLGTGFRGGLFFASLFLGALIGKVAAAVSVWFWVAAPLNSTTMALVGMCALAVSIVGGPLTMTFLVLETTGDLAITGVALAASVIASLTVRELFGYSFSTWRLHLRGETIRSAHDVGWIRNLTVGRMMRTSISTVRADETLAEFRQQFPLGSATRVIAVDRDGRYAGLVLVAEAHAPETVAKHEARTVGDIARYKDVVLRPQMNVREAIALFDRAESEELAVVDGIVAPRVVGVLTEAHALRRYAEETDRARRSLVGEA